MDRLAPLKPILKVLKRTAKELRRNNLTDWAAALTYYGLLSLFPALIAMVALIGLFGDPKATTSTLVEILAEIGPRSSAETFKGSIESVIANQRTAGLAFALGMAAALWSSSAYVGAFIRASNVIHGTTEAQPFWKMRPLQIAITLLMIAMMALLAIGLVLTGPIVEAIAGPVGLSSAAVDIWNLAKWPVMAVLFTAMVSILYYASPNVKVRGFPWVTLGSVVAIVVWGIASSLFAFYVANFGSYDKTYGTLGGLIALLVWLWITNLAILFGHQLNAAREQRPGGRRARQSLG